MLRKFQYERIITNLIIILVMIWAILGIFRVFGHYVEQRYYPVRISQSVDNIEYDRIKRFFCWDWHSEKIRNKTAKDIDLTVTDASGKKVVFTPFTRYTNIPWQIKGLPAAKYLQSYCIFIPTGFEPAQPFEIDIEIIYPGFLGLWNLHSDVPIIKYSDNNVK